MSTGAFSSHVTLISLSLIFYLHVTEQYQQHSDDQDLAGMEDEEDPPTRSRLRSVSDPKNTLMGVQVRLVTYSV